MNKVIHLIPYDGTGGVEVAARSMQGIDCPDLDFSIQCIYPHVRGYQERSDTFGPGPVLRAFLRTRAQEADMLIVSLWRACIVGLLVKLFQPRLKLVLMLHSTKNAHWLDRFVTSLTGRVANEWWGDSTATVNERLPGSPRKTKRVISFVTRRLHPTAATVVAPAFIFWGRISSIKGIDRALAIFGEIAKRHPGASLRLIGPDGGARAGLQALAEKMGLAVAVQFPGEMSMDQIQEEAASACFYLQASRYEGMAMSVVEAMQLGLIPVVTAVGEIRNYCRNGENAILIKSDEAAVDDVLKVLADRERYTALQNEAVAMWLGKSLYADSMLAACRTALTNTTTGSVPK